MCRSMTENGDVNDRLKIKAFHLRLSLAGAARLPETLTLIYLPPISTNHLEINGAKIRSPALVALYRTRSAEPAGGSEAVFASTDHVRAGEGARFEVYVAAERIVKGVLRRRRGWAMDCHCEMEVDLGVSMAEICVAGERGVVMRERVKMVKRRGRGFCVKLEEIPEEDGEMEMDGCDCCECDEGREVIGSDGRDGKWMDGGDDEMGEMEGVRWAVDVGIWVMCLGVGLLVKRASTKSWRRQNPFCFF